MDTIFGYATIPRGGKMIDGQSNISKNFGSRRLKALPDIRTFFQANEQPVALVSPTAFNRLGIDHWARKRCHAAGIRPWLR